jgi:hypothetical protein
MEPAATERLELAPARTGVDMTSIERCHVAGAVIGAALSAAIFTLTSLALAATPAESSATAPAKAGVVLAQAPSTGGSIGKSDKSIGGETAPPPASSPAPAPVPAAKPAAKPAAREAPSPPARRGGGGEGGTVSYDGTWTVVSVSPGCNSAPGIPGTGVVTISGGHISAQGLSGSVSSSGNSSSVYHGEGYISYASGRFSGRSGSGTFHTTTGCNGRWTAMKQ